MSKQVRSTTSLCTVLLIVLAYMNLPGKACSSYCMAVIDAALQLPVSRNVLDLDDYCSELVAISTAWESARKHIKVAQQNFFHIASQGNPRCIG